MLCNDDCQLRNENEHVRRCAVLNRSLTDAARKYWSRIYGITGSSVLMQVKDFPITEGLIHDPMHLLFEELTPAVIKHLLKHFICNLKILNAGAFNKKLLEFSQTIRANCRPNIIDENHLLSNESKLKQIAHSVWWLSNILPLIIADVVPETDDKWITFLRFLQVQQLCTSPIVTSATVRSLEIIVAQFITSYKNFFPELGFTPKLHYLVHLQRQIEYYGPACNHWCMRMEAKNGLLKRKNFETRRMYH